MVILKNGNLEKWKLGKMEIGKNGNLEKWKSRKMKMGKMEIGKKGIWKIGYKEK